MFLSEENLSCLEWYDWLWLIIPVAGVAIFFAVAYLRWKESK